MKKSFTGTIEQIKQFLWRFDKDKQYDIQIDVHKNKRSLNANNYAWKLITELANEMRLSKEEVYMQMLKDYGQSYKIETPIENKINDDSIKYFEKRDVFVKDGQVYQEYIIFRGTSGYDSKEMSIFIDGLVQECRQLGIETLEDLEIKRLLKEMEK